MNSLQQFSMGNGPAIIGGIIGLFVGALFLYWAAAIAKIEGRTYGKAFLANFFCIVISIGTSLLFAATPFVDILVWLILSFVLIKAVFSTTVGKAVIAWIMQIIFAAIVIGGIVSVTIIVARSLH
jgi:hypothetical protein